MLPHDSKTGWSVLLAIAGLAGPAMAAVPVGHAVVYTTPAADPARPRGAAVPRTNLPLLSPRTLGPEALLRRNVLPSGAAAGTPGVAAGSDAGSPGGMKPLEYGGGGGPVAIAPYTTARASASKLGPTRSADAVAVTSRPWSAAGQLTFAVAGQPYVCSASLIMPALVLTAAHCLFDFAAAADSGWHTDIRFGPAQFDPAQYPPYGSWTAVYEYIASSYYDGSDSCMHDNVGCNNDLAVLVMQPNSLHQLPGTEAGYFGYAWNGYGLTRSFGGASLALITQLGYPVAFDSGLMLERTDGVGAYWGAGLVKNLVLGSAMTGGASGGPWLVNFGAVPQMTDAASLGNASQSNVVIGVTSWGYTTVGTNTMGASWFGQNHEFPHPSYSDSQGIGRGAGNIGALVAKACSDYPGAC